ncbi:MAG: response regulator [Gemmatimonadetes bacterium]|jgi:CheY-like chemotaxis protein|nr:response regulator [Gemmatimonadota bacterium]
MAGTKVLIVEDEMIVARDLQGSLEGMGYEVAGIAVSGRMAVKLATRVRPDVVLMDIVLKGEMDGIEAAEEIGGLLDVPVIFLTAHSDKQTFARAKMTRPNGYIVKPFDAKKLQETIEAVLAS